MTATPRVTDGVTEANASWANSAAEHGVQDFSNSTARTAWGGTRYSGQVTSITGSSRLEIYDGAADQRLAHWAAAGRTATRVRRAAVQSAGTGATTDISWDTEDQDTDAAITVPATTLTVPAGLGGLWLVDVKVTWASDPGTSTALWLAWTIGGATWYTSTEQGSASRPGSTSFYTGISGAEYLAAGDTVKASVRQSSGAAINITARGLFTRLHI